MSLKILLADDSLTAQNMGKKILTDAGYEVIAVSNGAQAMKKIVSDHPDLVVLDVYMPGYTGLELCERMRNTRETARTPVVLSVGKMEPFKPEERNRVRADGLIIKPFEATELIAIIKKLAENLAAVPPAKAAPERESAPEATIERFSEPEFEIQHHAIEIPSEIAFTPAIGMELIPEETQEAPTPVVSVSSSDPGLIEFEVERDVEPADSNGIVRMPSAAGLSGVFELEPSAPPASGPSAEPAALETFDRFAAPDGPSAPSFEAGPDGFAHEFPVAELSAEVQFEPHDLVSASESLPAGETSSSEYAVERFDRAEPEAITPNEAPQLTSWDQPFEQARQTSEWAISDAQPTPSTELSHVSAEPTRNDSVAEPAPVWVAEEAAIEPHESAIPLHEQMQQHAISETSESEPEAPPAEAGEALSWEAPDRPTSDAQAPSEAPAPSQAEPLPQAEASWQAVSGEDQGTSPQPADFPESPTASAPAAAPDPALEASNATDHAIADYVAAIPEPEPHELPRVVEIPVDPARVARIVDEMLERLKPELIAAVTRQLEEKH